LRRALVALQLPALAAACRYPGPEADRSVSRSGSEPSIESFTAADAGVPAGAARSASWTAAVAERRTERERMVQEQLIARGIQDRRVLAALRSVPRHRFVPFAVRSGAYLDGPLPIPGDQTISQPYLVAFMTELAQIRAGARCLEIGTGSGYQAAILAELCGETYSIEYLPEVAAFGRSNLEALGYLERGVFLRVGDGYGGWPDKAPFDVILVTAAPEHVPQPLLDQLAVGGRLVIPVGSTWEQMLEVWTRLAPGAGHRSFARQRLAGVRFVPFLGPHGG
jgi:protein-L-isoaspartate(D-aspartate) O-methyltransferase